MAAHRIGPAVVVFRAARDAAASMVVVGQSAHVAHEV